MSKPPRVLAAVDPDVSSDLVLASAVDETARIGGELVVFYVFELLSVDFFGPPRSTDPAAPVPVEFARRKEDAEATVRELERRTRHALQTYADAHPGAATPAAEIHVAVGRPAQEIVWAAAHFDVELVVMGSHGRKGLSRLLLGSVSERVVRLAGCAVRIVREKNHDPQYKLPEIEPLCPDCAEARASSGGAKLWCARHAEHHVRAHIYSSAGRTESPSAYSSTTGT